MKKIADAFSNGKAFIPFITCGDPNLETTEQLIVKIAESGADLIELGIPFSDPTAEGPVIQQANIRALSAGTTTDKIFEMVERVNKNVDVPLVFMTYANVVFSYGTERFIKKAYEIGIAGLILPDVPYEEKEEFESVCEKYNIELVSLIAPTSKDRIEMIAKNAKGFIYCVSSLGVTGVRSRFSTNIADVAASIKAVAKVPCAIGFGISTPKQAKEMSKYADGVIVGSAIVKIIEKYAEDAIEPVCDYVKDMKKAIM